MRVAATRPLRDVVTDVPQNLPRGRHGIPRDKVVESQRRRMLTAMAEATAVEGYAATTVADVLARAGVSRETFYEQFSSKRECFLDALDVAADLLVEELERHVDTDGEPIQRVENALGGYLDTVAANPLFSRLLLVEAPAAGEPAIERRADAQRQIVDTLSDTLELSSDEDRLACELVVAGVEAMASRPLAAGDVEAIDELRRPLVAQARKVLAPTARS